MIDIENYIKQIYNVKHDFALWGPNQNINIGDIGTLKKRNFQHYDNLKNLGIDFKTQTDAFETEYLYESDGVIELNSDAEAGTTNPLVTNKIGYGYEFTDKEAILVHTINSERQKITNNISIEEKIKELVKSNKWKKEWVYVNEVIKCDYGVYLISDKGACSINITSEQKIGNNKINVAAFDVENKVDYSQFRGTHIIVKSPHTPFIRLLKYHKSFFNRESLYIPRRSRGDRFGYSPPDIVHKEKIDEITLNEFLNS